MNSARTSQREAFMFDPAGPAMRSMIVTVLLVLLVIVLLVVGTIVTLAVGGALAGCAVHTAREAVHRYHERRARSRG